MRRIRFFVIFSCWLSVLAGQHPPAVDDVYDFGAKGDGVTNDRDAIQRAIDACAADGGRIGSISNISFRNIRGDEFTQQFPSIITGIPGQNIQNVTLENIDLNVRGEILEGNREVMEYDGN